MVELIGDDCQPSSFTTPVENNNDTGARVGILKMSGSKLFVVGTGGWEVVTSTAV